MPSKSFNKFTLIDELSSQFPKVYTVTLKLLNIIVFGDSCLPRQVNLWLGVESNHWHITVQVIALPWTFNRP